MTPNDRTEPGVCRHDLQEPSHTIDVLGPFDARCKVCFAQFSIDPAKRRNGTGQQPRRPDVCPLCGHCVTCNGERVVEGTNANAGTWSRCPTCTGQQPAQPLDVSWLPMGDAHPIELVKAGCDPISGRPAQSGSGRAEDAAWAAARAWTAAHAAVNAAAEAIEAAEAKTRLASENYAAAQPGSGEVVKVSIEAEAEIEASLLYSGHVAQRAFIKGYVRAATLYERRLRSALANPQPAREGK